MICLLQTILKAAPGCVSDIMNLLMFRLLISLLLLLYTRVPTIQAFSHLVSLDSAKLVLMFFPVKPQDVCLEVQFFSVGGGDMWCAEAEKKKRH